MTVAMLIAVLSHFVQNPHPIQRLIAHVLQLILGAFLLCAGSAQAQLASVPTAGIELTKLEVLHDVPYGLSLAQVQTNHSGGFVPKTSLHVSHPHWDRSLWLRLHLKANASASQPQPAVLMMPTPYLDKVLLYTPAAGQGDPWLVQQAGDFLEPHTWAMRSFYPKFNIPSPADPSWQGRQDMVIYIQIEHLAPVMLHLEMTDASYAMERDLLNLIIYCLGLGAMLLCALLTASMAWLHRDAIYAWYSTYALCAALACASHSGIAQNLLWPVGGYWPGTAVLSFILLCGVCQMQFSLCLNTDRPIPLWLRAWIHLASAACIVLAIGFPIFTAYWQSFYFATLFIIAQAMMLSIGLMILGMRAGHRLARVWLLTYIPLFSSIFLGLLEGVGLLPSSYWSYSLAIYAVMVEVLILGLALQWFARERHGEIERAKAIATLDPLTGFATSSAFQTHLHDDWHQAAKHKYDTAIAYIELKTKTSNNAQREQLLMRSVRILRAATHAQDMVARLDGQLLAMIMPKMSMGEDLSQLLSRIVALGLIPDRSDHTHSILQFRIAATTRRHFNGSLEQLNAQLRDLLAQPSGWGSRPIRVIDHLARSAKPATPDKEFDDLEDIWDRALAAEGEAMNTFEETMANR
jgi:GGDEF domain-containing protein